MSKQVLTVSSLVRYLKNRLEGDSMTQHVLVEGELSNFSNYRSGHWYFTLKDSNAQLRCAMFASSNRKISYVPKDGDKVLVQGDISVFEGRGEMQLIVTNMKPSGIGDLFIQFEALKKKLSEEGLFAEEHKKEIPLYPEHIGLVTGKNTAARSDVLTTLQRRWPVAEVHEYPVLVQGTGSAEQITDALKYMDTLGYDVILLVRGGGSIEDLWSFNSEMLARTIYDMHTPIITGVGHEVDFTIADFVADLRAPTPTGAAERCSPDIREVKDFVRTMKDRLNRETTALLNTSSQRLDISRNSAIFRDPEKMIRERRFALNTLLNGLEKQVTAVNNEYQIRLNANENQLISLLKTTIHASRMTITHDREKLYQSINDTQLQNTRKLREMINLLDAYSPLKVLERGYSIVMKDTTVINTVSQLNKDDPIHIRLHDGQADARITKIIQED